MFRNTDLGSVSQRILNIFGDFLLVGTIVPRHQDEGRDNTDYYTSQFRWNIQLWEIKTMQCSSTHIFSYKTWSIQKSIFSFSCFVRHNLVKKKGYIYMLAFLPKWKSMLFLFIFLNLSFINLNSKFINVSIKLKNKSISTTDLPSFPLHQLPVPRHAVRLRRSWWWTCQPVMCRSTAG